MMSNDQIDKIKAMVAAGFTSFEIADRIGRPRSSVLGWCYRNKISLECRPEYRRRRRRKSEIEQRPLDPPLVPPVEPPLGPYKRWTIKGIGMLPSCAKPRPDGLGVDLLHHKAGQCLFILGETSAMRCCGEPATGSWCAEHRRIVIESCERPEPNIECLPIALSR